MKRFAACLVLAMIAQGCSTPSLAPRPFAILTDAKMADLGQEAFIHLKEKIPRVAGARVGAYVGCVVQALEKELEGSWEAVVFDRQGPNAFALPGGKLGVFNGMFTVARNQDQLAVVVAHVMAHVSLRHIHERVSQYLATAQGVNFAQAIANPDSQEGRILLSEFGIGSDGSPAMPFGRLQESEADFLGLDLMAKAGFDPRQSVELWSNMSRLGGGQAADFFVTHPSTPSRLEDLQSHLPIAMELRQHAAASGKKPECD